MEHGLCRRVIGTTTIDTTVMGRMDQHTHTATHLMLILLMLQPAVVAGGAEVHETTKEEGVVLLPGDLTANRRQEYIIVLHQAQNQMIQLMILSNLDSRKAVNV